MNQIPDKNKDGLNKLFSTVVPEQPSANFTNDVLSKLGIAPEVSIVKVEPVISQKAWIVIGILSVLLIGYLLFLSFSQAPVSTTDLTSQLFNQLDKTVTPILNSSLLLLMACLTSAVFLLSFLDSALRNGKLQLT